VRIAGLASGLDIDSMVKELMAARRESANKYYYKRVTLEWQQEAYREISTKIVDFRNNKLASFNMSKELTAKKANVSGNETAVTVNSVDPTAAGTLNVKVNKVATVATKVFTYDPDDNDGTVNSTDGLTLSALGFTGSLQVNGITITYDASVDTLQTLADKINADPSIRATALYDKTKGQFSITSWDTGKGTLVVTGFSTEFDESSSGEDAEIVVNGITYTSTSNKFSIGGIDFTVKAETGATDAVLSVVTDTDKIFNTIKSFVEEYNKLIETINGELNEERFRSYHPLTKEQEEEMSEKQIEMWEAKARSGLLRNDTILSKFVSEMRIATMAVYAENVKLGDKTHAKLSLAAIGITTGSWQERGKLVIDEEKLRAAIEDDPQLVADMFMKPGDASKPDNQGVGLFNKLSKYALDALKELSEKAGTSMVSTDLKTAFLEDSLLSEEIRSYKRREEEWSAKLIDMENRLYKQFAAMEAAINKYNAQASSLMSFFN